MAAYAQYNGCGYPSANQVSYVIINQVLCYCHVYVYVTFIKIPNKHSAVQDKEINIDFIHFHFSIYIHTKFHKFKKFKTFYIIAKLFTLTLTFCLIALKYFKKN